MAGKRTKFLYMLGQLYRFCEDADIEIIVFTFYRSPADQEQEFIKGKSKIKENGPHQFWLAQDIAIVENGKALFDDSSETRKKYQMLGEFWKSLDPQAVWGGDFKSLDDIYHFELKRI